MAPKSKERNQFFLLPTEAVILCPDPSGLLRPVCLDREDLDRVLAAGHWRVANCYPKGHRFYAYIKIENKNVYLHRFLVEPPPGLVVDHDNHNGLDNRRSKNLFVRTHARNQLNRERPNGYYCPGKGYVAGATVDRKYRRIGYYPTLPEAQQAVANFKAKYLAQH